MQFTEDPLSLFFLGGKQSGVQVLNLPAVIGKRVNHLDIFVHISQNDHLQDGATNHDIIEHDLGIKRSACDRKKPQLNRFRPFRPFLPSFQARIKILA